MTLGGLALAVGILVDEATVAIENIHAHLARGVPLARAALDATRETAVPRLLAMLCILAVFTPALFMTGAAKALFTPLALAVGFAMIASYFLSARRSCRSSASGCCAAARGTSSERRNGRRIYRGASPAPRSASRWLLVPIYLAAAVFVIWIIGARLGVEIFPKADAGQMALRVKAPTGTKLEVTEQLALRALDIIKREAGADNIALTMGLVGVHASNYPVNLIHLWNGGPEEAWLAVQFKKGAPVRVEALQEKLRGVFAQELPGARVAFEPSDIVTRVMSFGSSTPIEVAVSGPDLAVSREYAEKIFAKLKDHARAARRAVRADARLPERECGREPRARRPARREGERRDARARRRDDVEPLHAADLLERPEDRRELQPAGADPADADEVARRPAQRAGRSRRQIRAAAQRRHASRPARSSASTSATTWRAWSASPRTSTAPTSAPWRGRSRRRSRKSARRRRRRTSPCAARSSRCDELLDGFRSGLIVAVVVVFLLLAANFQSFRLSLAVVSTVPAVLAGVVLMLWITGTTLNIQSAIGAIMAVGVAVANAILLVTFAERAHRRRRARSRRRGRRRGQPPAPDPDDQLRDDRRLLLPGDCGRSARSTELSREAVMGSRRARRVR